MCSLKANHISINEQFTSGMAGKLQLRGSRFQKYNPRLFSKLSNLLCGILRFAQIHLYVNDTYQQRAKQARQAGRISRCVSMLGTSYAWQKQAANWRSIYCIVLYILCPQLTRHSTRQAHTLPSTINIC